MTARASGGRPQQLFVLTDEGREAFPRHYSWFAQLLVEEITKEHGAVGLRTRLGRIASAVVAQLQQQRSTHNASSRQKIEALSAVMDELGYDARMGKDANGPTIEADNCIFHEIAMKRPEICHFDLALLSGYTGNKVELHEIGHLRIAQAKGLPAVVRHDDIFERGSRAVVEVRRVLPEALQRSGPILLRRCTQYRL